MSVYLSIYLSIRRGQFKTCFSGEKRREEGREAMSKNKKKGKKKKKRGGEKYKRKISRWREPESSEDAPQEEGQPA